MTNCIWTENAGREGSTWARGVSVGRWWKCQQGENSQASQDLDFIPGPRGARVGVGACGMVGYSHSLLQGIFQTQGSNPGLLHCRQILYRLSYQGNSCLDTLTIKKACCWGNFPAGPVYKISCFQFRRPELNPCLGN